MLSSPALSVKHALSLLGEREVRRWVRLIATFAPGQDQTPELVSSALVRARFCKVLSPRVQHGDSDLFLLGPLSLMDVTLEIPIAHVVERVPIDQTKAVLLGGASRLQPLYRLMLALESAEWQNTSELAKAMYLSESEVAEAHWQAMQGARQVSSG